MAVNIPLQTLFANTRAGTVYQTTSAGGISAVSANTTRTAHWRGGKPHALFEPSRTNSIRNNTNVGAVIGSPGTLPTNWAAFGGTIATEVAGLGTEGGASYIDIRVTGSPSTSGTINFDATNAIVATPGQNWTLSFNARIVGGTPTNVAFIQPAINWRDGGGAFLSRSLGADFKSETSAGSRVLVAQAPASTGYALPQIFLNCTGAVDFTLRIYVAQMELGAFATSPILTSGSAVIRAADNATCSVSTFPIDQNGGSIEIIGRADYTTSGSGFPRIFQIDDGTNNNRLTLFIDEALGTIGFGVVVGGVTQASEVLSYTSGAEFHVIVTFEGDNVFLSLGGSDSTPDTTASLPTGLLATWRWARSATGDNGASVLINRIASHSHEFSTTAANTITG